LNLSRTRRVFQGFFLLLFLWLSLETWARVRWGGSPEMAGWPVSLFLDLDPLAALGSLLASGSLYTGWTGWNNVGAAGVVLALFSAILTLFLGRVFCGWFCPLGTLQQLTAWLFAPKARKEAIRIHEYKRGQRVKYWILAFFFASALAGSLQVGWLDPIPLVTRSFALAVWPLADLATRPFLSLLGAAPVYPSGTPGFQGAWFIALLFLAVLAASAWIPRFFCRWLCPLGALLGVLSRWAPFRIRRWAEDCIGCRACVAGCQGGADPDGEIRASECMVCMNCLDPCPTGCLSFGPAGKEDPVQAGPDPGRRGLVLGALAGLVAAPLARLTGSRGPSFGTKLIRPPGSVQEDAFLERCLKCGQCMRVCPTGVLQPAWAEAGPEGVWTPVLDMRRGYCDPECTACSLVCPTGAIRKLTPAQKAGREPWLGTAAPVTIGTAFVDTTRCIPWALDTACLVCQEVCPVSPKAILTHKVTGADGKEIGRPWVDPNRCIGCGICEHECPVVDLRAIRVTPVGERRSRGFGEGKDRSFLFPGGK